MDVRIPRGKEQEFIHALKHFIGASLAQAMIARAPSNTSNLRQRIWYKITDKGIEITMPKYSLYLEYGSPGIKEGKSSTVGNKTVSFGAKADRKMPLVLDGDTFKLIPELADWVKKRGGDPENWWPLAKHIQLYGTEPHPFIRPALFLDLDNIVQRGIIYAKQKVAL